MHPRKIITFGDSTTAPRIVDDLLLDGMHPNRLVTEAICCVITTCGLWL